MIRARVDHLIEFMASARNSIAIIQSALALQPVAVPVRVSVAVHRRIPEHYQH
jgi:hypothetical protein